MSKTVTLKDIAKEAGVSTTTVSRILNGRDSGIPIRDETRERVIAIAHKLGYRPNLLARGLRGSRSSLLGVILRDISDPFHIQILRGVDNAASRRGYRLFLGHVDYNPDVAIAYGSMFEQSHADGILIIGDIQDDEDFLDTLVNQHQHVVGVTDRIARRVYPGVYSDNELGTRLVLDHFWNLGHRAIACVSDPRNSDGRHRVEVYQQYMREHGVEGRERIHMTSQDPDECYQVGQEFFASFRGHDRPTAIYAASDTIAIYFMQAAYQAGIAIPEQVSIVGYDNIDIAAFTIPPLTTINQSGVKMGEMTTNLLLDMIENELDSADVNDVILSPTLVIRQSTAAPPTR